MSATGTLLDHNFSQYSWEGAKKGAVAIGAKEPATVVPKDSTEYAKNIQNFIDAGYNVIITVGFDEGEATKKDAKANPNVQFIGVDQSPICVDASGGWLLFGCKGDAAKLLPNYMSLWCQEDQPGYLAGMLAAGITKTGVVGAVGGITIVPPSCATSRATSSGPSRSTRTSRCRSRTSQRVTFPKRSTTRSA